MGMFLICKLIQGGTIMFDMSEAFKISFTCISDSFCRMNFRKNYHVVGRIVVPPNGAPPSNPCIPSVCYITGQEGTGLHLERRLLIRDPEMGKLSWIVQTDAVSSLGSLHTKAWEGQGQSGAVGEGLHLPLRA